MKGQFDFPVADTLRKCGGWGWRSGPDYTNPSVLWESDKESGVSHWASDSS